MATKLFVGNLPYAATEGELQQYFSEAGNVVSVKIISDKMTGRSKGFCFVEMGSEEEAAQAIAMFNGKEYQGRPLVVNEARPMTDRPARPRSFTGARQ